MDERSEVEKGDEVILPGFRFHPTDEELVGFYLKRKVEQRALAVELIRQLDIYKYDPWDLPKLATTGENEWYFYCPRDRKYRNSTRPNRVTGAGFWKATGTDRPIHSSSQGGSKCIGLKKSLVFYKGRAAKGTKTDWMMHEFRLPSLAPSSLFKNNIIPPNESWAICKIFKKTNSAARRAVSHSWVSPLPEKKKNEPADADLFSISDIISRMTQSEAATQDCLNNLSLQREQLLQNNFMAFPPLDFSSCCKPSAANQMLNLPPMIPGDVESLSTGIDFGGRQQQQCGKLVVDLPMEINANWRREYLSLNKIENMDSLLNYLPPTSFSDEWKQSLLYM